MSAEYVTDETKRDYAQEALVAAHVCKSRLERVGDEVVRVHLCTEEEREEHELSGRNGLRIDDFPSVHVGGEVGNAACEVDSEGSDCVGSAGGEGINGLGEGDNTVFSHEPEPIDGAG